MPFVYAVSFNEALLEQLPIVSLPAGWNSGPTTIASQSFGGAGFVAARSAVLAAPCVIASEERKHVLNPHYPSFAEVQISP